MKPKETQTVLGHEDSCTTQEIYTDGGRHNDAASQRSCEPAATPGRTTRLRSEAVTPVPTC
jgi:hypothetical protein